MVIIMLTKTTSTYTPNQNCNGGFHHVCFNKFTPLFNSTKFKNGFAKEEEIENAERSWLFIQKRANS